MNLGDQISSALGQVIVVFGIGCLIYGFVFLFFRQKLAGQSLFTYLGISPTNGQLDSYFWIIWFCLIVFGIASIFLEFHFSDSFRLMLTSESSPYGKILRSGFNASAVAKALIYCFVQSGCAEELLFRGLFAKRLIHALGRVWGNVLQAVIFWLMHLIVFRFVIGDWFSVLQVVAFVTSFGLGMVLAYVNFRKDGESIIPSWILHGSVNFFSFLTLAMLWPA